MTLEKLLSIGFHLNLDTLIYIVIGSIFLIKKHPKPSSLPLHPYGRFAKLLLVSLKLDSNKSEKKNIISNHRFWLKLQHIILCRQINHFFSKKRNIPNLPPSPLPCGVWCYFSMFFPSL
jgi:hypothetical protein